MFLWQHVHCGHPCSVHIWEVTLVRLYGYSLWCFEKTQSHSKLPDSLALRIVLAPLPQCSLSRRHKNCFTDVSIGIGRHNSTFGLVMVFSCGLHLLETFPWWGVKTTLICANPDLSIYSKHSSTIYKRWGALTFQEARSQTSHFHGPSLKSVFFAVSFYPIISQAWGTVQWRMQKGR